MVTSSLTSCFFLLYWLVIQYGLSQSMMSTVWMLRVLSLLRCVCVCQRACEDDKSSAVCFGFPGQPCLTERQWSKTLTCRRTCSRTPWSVPRRPWRSTTSRKTSLHTSKRWKHLWSIKLLPFSCTDTVCSHCVTFSYWFLSKKTKQRSIWTKLTCFCTAVMSSYFCTLWPTILCIIHVTRPAWYLQLFPLFLRKHVPLGPTVLQRPNAHCIYSL